MPTEPDRGVETRLLRELVEIASESGAEGPVARHLVTWMDKLGYEARLDEVGNAIGEIGDPAGPVIVLLGHMDTVPGDVPVRIEGSRLYGRGSVDAKGPLATMVCAGARVGPTLPARLVVIGAVDEERDSIGARHVADRYRPAAVVVGEPSGSGQCRDWLQGGAALHGRGAASPHTLQQPRAEGGGGGGRAVASDPAPAFA
jgi:LysW-gamma-L-lysine carboxypeptidase